MTNETFWSQCCVNVTPFKTHELPFPKGTDVGSVHTLVKILVGVIDGVTAGVLVNVGVGVGVTQTQPGYLMYVPKPEVLVTRLAQLISVDEPFGTFTV